LKGKILCLLMFFIALSGLLVVIPTTKGTFVSEDISQNTTWTESNSPYVISYNINILSNVTLNIENNVIVKFGGAFSIYVYGSLNAIGTNSKRIIFTSNSISPSTSDWERIECESGSQVYLDYCLVEYSKHGVSGNGGDVLIENSIFKNDEYCTGGYFVATNCIFENTLVATSGTISKSNFVNSNCSVGRGALISQNSFVNGHIYAAGSDCIISQNVLQGNGKTGVHAWDNPGIEPNYNCSILNNTVTGYKAGILIIYEKVEVRENNIHDNEIGISFPSGYTPAIGSDNILNNSIWSNEYGILFDTYVYGDQIQIHYNDIYLNSIGVNVNNGAIANATNNYWGDPSGPYHTSLNPSGKGNSAGGNGYDLIFIPFLSSPATNMPLPTPSPSLTPIPTPSPTPTPTPTPSPSVVNPSPSVPEFPSIPILIITFLVSAALAGTIALQKKLSAR
jgi:hypothetical protein